MVSNSNQIEEIKDKLDIVQIVEKYVKLKQTGKNFSGLCPFHNEKTPSFIVSPDIQRYKCFGCGETGDIFNFIQKVENIDFPEALERLAKEAGIELQKNAVNYKYKVLEDINYNATKYYYNSLKKDKRAYEYIKERGFSDESIKTFGIGYAPRYPELLKYLLKIKKYNQKELIDSGLFTLKEGKIREKFYDRIMFPIRSRKGTVIAFTGRILPGNDFGPKYMNSPDTPIFHKKENLFGQYESRQGIRKNDIVIICEGSTDVISAHQHGFKNIVAPLGTGLTKEQLENISYLTKNILFFFDSDQAGQEALVRGFKLASELKLAPYATNSSPYKDIDELLQKNPQKMSILIKKKVEAFSFILAQLLQNADLNKLEDLNKIRATIGLLLDSVTDDTTKNHYISKFSKITKIESDLRKTEKNSSFTGIVGSEVLLPVKFENRNLENHYLKLILAKDKIKEDYLVPSEYIKNKSNNSIMQTLQSYYKKKNVLFDKLKSDELLVETFENLIFKLSEIPTDQTEITEQIYATIKLLKERHLKEKQKELSVKIAIAEENKNYKESEKLLRELIEVNKILKGEK